jgi:hypothetical protein
MTIMRSVLVSFAMILISVSSIYGQDLSTYRNFSLGMSLADVSRLTDKRPTDAIVVHERPVLLQQLTWWPARIANSSLGGEAIQEIRFSFYKGELYKIGVTYDNVSTRGLTPEDMLQAMTLTYGTAAVLTGEIKDNYGTTEKVLARWEDSHYSLNLFRSSLSNSFRLVMFIKQLNTQAEAASVEAARLAAQEGPAKELARAKQEVDDLETARQKNIKTFHP